MKNTNNKPRVEIFVRSNIGHLQQLYAGFAALDRAGEIDLVQRLKHRPNMITSAEPHLRDARLAHCSVLVNTKCRIYYDMHDSWEIDEEALGKHDFYYKRSFQPERYPKTFRGSEKIRAYGLNYEVVSNPIDQFALRRSWLARSSREFLTTMGWATGLANLWQFVPSLSRMEASPLLDEPTTVLFMARTWDPNQSSSDLDTKRKLDRDSINQMRAHCIRALRDAFGERFFGGFAPSDFACKTYPDLVLNNNSYKKRNYISILQRNAIGVATAGLHGSVGWKMAEYVAFSRAIVSEKFNALIPGNFAEPFNYLSFQSADECVNQVSRLVKDDEFRLQMMKNNLNYYLSYLAPKELVARSLEVAMG